MLSEFHVLCQKWICVDIIYKKIFCQKWICWLLWYSHISTRPKRNIFRGLQFNKDSSHSLRWTRSRQEIYDYHYTLKCLLLLLSNYCIFCFIHHRWILNIDQTPVYFSMHPRKTLARKGNKTIHVWSSTDDTKRATDAVTITASWNKLPLMMIFKGTECGCIAKRRIAHNHKGPIHVCQENAWMDCNAMPRWVDLVMKPYISKAPTDIWPILCLDSYCCHMLHNVIDKIRKLGVKVQHIPAGCTCYCQPADVRYNKLFKSRSCPLWHDWIKEFGKEKTAIKSPTQEN